MSEPLDETLEMLVRTALEKKAENVVILDVKPLTVIADYFVILSGRSSRQVSAIAEHVEKTVRRRGIKPLCAEGRGEGQWVLMDYGHVVLHIFYESVRRFYDLEGLWTDAKRIRIPGIQMETPDDDFDDSEYISEYYDG
jgi:ribosome-associated protein